MFLVNINSVFASVWTSTSTVSCGGIKNIPSKVPELSSSLISVVQVVVPVLLVVFGSIDLAKAVMGQKEDEIKKGQQTLIKRIIMGMLVFLVIALVKLLLNLAVENTSTRESIISCVNCFISNNCG